MTTYVQNEAENVYGQYQKLITNKTGVYMVAHGRMGVLEEVLVRRAERKREE